MSARKIEFKAGPRRHLSPREREICIETTTIGLEEKLRTMENRQFERGYN